MFGYINHAFYYVFYIYALLVAHYRPTSNKQYLKLPKKNNILLCAVTPTALLAAVITLSNSVIYDFYIGSPPHFSWTTLEDQKIAGLLMWIPGNLVYLITLVSLFFKWFESEEKKIYKS